jgi:hypothetical protein
VLVVLMGILSFALITRSDVETTMLKVPGTLYQRSDGFITNLYNVEFVNKTFDDVALDLKIESPQTAELVSVDNKAVVVASEGLLKKVFFIKIPEKKIVNARTIVVIGVYSGNKKLETLKVKFIGPVSRASDAKRD